MPKYGVVRHIARGVLFSCYGEALIVMLSVYMDTSGNRRGKTMTMGAMLSTVDRWDAFQDEWPVFLRRYGVGSLHMTDFVSSKKEFDGWDRPEYAAKRKRFIDRAVVCAKKHTQRGFTSSLSLADYKAANARYELEECLGPPLTLCGMGVLREVGLWAKRNGIDETKILYFMEDGDQDKGKFIETARKYGFKVQPLTKKDACAFQVCDMAAWKYNAGLRDADDKKGTFERISKSLEVMGPIIQHGIAVDKHRLLMKCIEKPIPTRGLELR